MRLSVLRRLLWRAAAAKSGGKEEVGGGALPVLRPGSGCQGALLLPRGICGTWVRPDKQQGSGSGGLRGSAASEIIENSRKALNLLQRQHPMFKPTLAVVQVGHDDQGQKMIKNVAEEIGLNIVHICLPQNYTEHEVIDEIVKLNENPKIHGVLLRLSKESYTSKILNAVKPEKDVNGVTDFNLARLVHGDMHECVIPPTASAVVRLLEKKACTTLDGKKVLLLGVQGSLDVSLQCLLQRKGVMTMSCMWKMKQLQTLNGILLNILSALRVLKTGTESFFVKPTGDPKHSDCMKSKYLGTQMTWLPNKSAPECHKPRNVHVCQHCSEAEHPMWLPLECKKLLEQTRSCALVSGIE